MPEKNITVQELLDNPQLYQTHDIYLPTFNGEQWVKGIRNPQTDPWAVCPKDNGGFGMSYCVHYGTTLIAKEKDRQLK